MCWARMEPVVETPHTLLDRYKALTHRGLDAQRVTRHMQHVCVRTRHRGKRKYPHRMNNKTKAMLNTPDSVSFPTYSSVIAGF